MHNGDRAGKNGCVSGMQTLGVREFLGGVKSELPHDRVSIRGEVVGSHHHAASGHLYFELKERDAALRCVAYRYSGPPVCDGVVLTVLGKQDLFIKRGSFQLVVSEVDVQEEDVGEASRARALLLEALQQERVILRPRRRLPTIPSLVAIVTSEQSAAAADMLAEVEKRWPRLTIRVFHTAVQGAGAPQSIADAIHAATRLWPCVLILARGGGSAEDLAAFDTEQVVRSLLCASESCCTVSAIGHETDFPVVDSVADVRAKTPTAAIQMVVPARADMDAELASLRAQLRATVEARVRELRGALPGSHLLREARGALQRIRAETAVHREELKSACAMAPRRGWLREVAAQLPGRGLPIGLVAVFSNDGRPITSSEEADWEEELVLLFPDGHRCVKRLCVEVSGTG